MVWLGKFDGNTGEFPSQLRTLQLDKHAHAAHNQMHLCDGVSTIEANADKSMNLLARPVEADINKTAILC